MVALGVWRASSACDSLRYPSFPALTGWLTSGAPAALEGAWVLLRTF
jgi:hypothetical protein